MTDPTKTPAEGQENEGEGSRTAAQDYENRVQEYLAEANVTTKAREAAEALDSAEGEALRQAEEAGRAKADNENTQVKRER
jgi:hypothetical protein